MHIPWTSDAAQRLNVARRVRQRRRVVLAAGIFLSLVFFALWGHSSDGGPLTRFLARGLRPVVLVEDSLTRGLTGGSGRFQDLWDTAAQLAEVRERNLTLEALLAEREQVGNENRFLRESLGMMRSLGVRALPARVIGRNQSGTQSVVIDLGSSDGLRPFDPVFRPEGAVGYVTRVLEQSSLVLLLTDRNARLGVAIIVGASQEAIQGRTRGLPDGSHLLLQTKSPQPLPRESEVVTSSLSTIFFPGVRVGRVVTGIGSAGGLLDEYVVTPAVDMSQVDWVLVLTQTHREEAVELLEVPPAREENMPP